MLDEIEKALALDDGADGVADRARAAISPGPMISTHTTACGRLEQDPAGLPVSDPTMRQLDGILPAEPLQGWREELSLVSEACQPFDREAFLEGHLTPVYFGSALQEFRRARSARRAHRLCAAAARPGDVDRAPSMRREGKMTGIVFKIQANMDPNHRDRIAFMRLASGRLSAA